MVYKKVLVLVLAFVLLFSSTSAFGYTFDDDFDTEGLPPGIAKKMFDDMGEINWAERAIERMALKGLIQGYGNRKFNPRGKVTKLEAIIMAIRIIDKEKDIKLYNELPKGYKGKKVATWSLGYVAFAFENGILDEKDRQHFNPNAPAKRYEIAKYVVRALGYEKEAQRYMNQKLSFIDAPAIPSEAIGYVYWVVKHCIMEGDGIKFKPMEPITRAEMAVLFSRIDDMVDGEIDRNEAIGNVINKNKSTIILNVKGTQRIYDVASGVRVYHGDKNIGYNSIEIGQRVRLILQNSKVIYIEVLNPSNVDKIISRYSGNIVKVQTVNPKTITLRVEAMEIEFKVLDSAAIQFKNGYGLLEEIRNNDYVTVTVDTQNRVRHIYVHRNRNREVWDQQIEGILQGISDTSITLETNGETQEYTLDENLNFKVIPMNIDLSKKIILTGIVTHNMLETGFYQLLGYRLSGNDDFSLYEGQLVRVVGELDASPSIYMTKAIHVETIQAVDSIEKLERGMQVKAIMKDNVIINLTATDNEIYIQGKIIAITTTELGMDITIETGDKTQTYKLYEHAEIPVKDIKALAIGFEGGYRIVNNTIYEILINN